MPPSKNSTIKPPLPSPGYITFGKGGDSASSLQPSTVLEKLLAEFSRWELWGTLLDHATVYASDDIRFTFRNGAEIRT